VKGEFIWDFDYGDKKYLRSGNTGEVSYALKVMRRLREPTSHPLKDGPNALSLLEVQQIDSIEAWRNSLLK